MNGLGHPALCSSINGPMIRFRSRALISKCWFSPGSGSLLRFQVIRPYREKPRPVSIWNSHRWLSARWKSGLKLAETPHRVMKLPPGSLLSPLVIRAAAFSVQRPRRRSFVRHSRSMAGGSHRVRLYRCHQQVRRRAGVRAQVRGRPFGQSRREGRSAGSGGSRAARHGAGSGG